VIEGGGDDREEPMLLLLLLLLQQQITFWIGTHATHCKARLLFLFKLLCHFNYHVEKEHVQAHCCPWHVSNWILLHGFLFVMHVYVVTFFESCHCASWFSLCGVLMCKDGIARSASRSTKLLFLVIIVFFYSCELHLITFFWSCVSHHLMVLLLCILFLFSRGFYVQG